MNTLEKSGTAPPLQDNYSFRLIPWDNLDQKFKIAKCREQGENDLHLSVPGLWSSTLYPEIFGVSESWMILLSQVIRLSNEKELTETDAGPTRLSVKEFMKSAKALEVFILRFDSTIGNERVHANSELMASEADWIVLEAMNIALRHALAIYFYRRIYDVEPDNLQPMVIKVRESLSACKLSCDVVKRCLQGLLWSAFIAGCEALDVQLQASFADWFDSEMAQCYGSLGARLRQMMQQIWDRRKNGSTRSATWLDLLRQDAWVDEMSISCCF